MDPTSSSLLRICNENVVAYLKLLEICAASTLVAASNQNRQQKKNRGNTDVDADADDAHSKSLVESAAFVLQGKKQLLFRGMELLRRDGDGESILRVFSHEERRRRFVHEQQQQQQQQGSTPEEERLLLFDVYGQLLRSSRRRILEALPDLGVDDTAVTWPPAHVIEQALRDSPAAERFQEAANGIETLIVKPKIFTESALQKLLPVLATASSSSSPSPVAADSARFDQRLLRCISLSDALLVHSLESDAPGLYECTASSSSSSSSTSTGGGAQHAVARRRKRAGDHANGADELSMAIQAVCEQDVSANLLLRKRTPAWLKHKKNTNAEEAAAREQQQLEADEAARKSIPAMEYQSLLLAKSTISVSDRADMGLLDPAKLAADSHQVARALRNVAISMSSSGATAALQEIATPPLLSVSQALETVCLGTSPKQLMLRLQEADAQKQQQQQQQSPARSQFNVRYGAHITVVGFSAASAPLLVLVPRNGERDAARIRELARSAIETGQSLVSSLLSPAQAKKLAAAANKQAHQKNKQQLDLDAAAERLELRVFFTPAASTTFPSSETHFGEDAISHHYGTALVGDPASSNNNRRFFATLPSRSSSSSAAAAAGARALALAGCGQQTAAVLQDPDFFSVEFPDAEVAPSHAAEVEQEAEARLRLGVDGDHNDDDDDDDDDDHKHTVARLTQKQKHHQHDEDQDRYWPVLRVVRVASAPVLASCAIAVLHGHRAAGHASPRQLLTSFRAQRASEERRRFTAAAGLPFSSAAGTAAGAASSGGGGAGAVASHLGEAAAAEEEKLVADQKFLEGFFVQEAKRKAEQKEKAAAAKSQQLAASAGGAGGFGGAAAGAAAAAGSNAVAADDQAVSISVIRILTQQPGARLDVISRALGGGVQQNQLVRVLRKVAEFDRSSSGWKLRATAM